MKTWSKTSVSHENTPLKLYRYHFVWKISSFKWPHRLRCVAFIITFTFVLILFVVVLYYKKVRKRFQSRSKGFIRRYHITPRYRNVSISLRLINGKHICKKYISIYRNSIDAYLVMAYENEHYKST